jgi:2-methylcitrate dehydratase PrpD
VLGRAVSEAVEDNQGAAMEHPHHRGSERLADFVARHPTEAIPDEAIAWAKAGILDYVGVALAGIHEESAALVRKAAEAMGANPQAGIWGTKRKTSVPLAAMVNGTAAHALDFDDTNPVMLAHPSLQLLPGLFALGEQMHCNGRNLITAYVIGFELGAVLGRALHPNHVAQGWLPIGTLGPLMQASACARLLRLTPGETQMALSLASNLASGLRCNNGSMAKHFLAGYGAHSGVISALLARDGLTANPKALESRFGYFENFSRSDPERLEQAIDAMGKPLAILESGISFKLYPCCAGAHVAIDCALEIAAHHSPAAQEIAAVDLLVHQGLKAVLIHSMPRTVTEARFSLEYCVSRALLDREMGPDQFIPRKIRDASVRSLIERVSITYHDKAFTADDMSASRFPVEMRVHLNNGTVLTARVDHAKGTISNPVSWNDLEKKFRQCVANPLGELKIEKLLEQLNKFEEIEDIGEFVAMLS